MIYRKILVTILSFSLSVSLLCGCGTDRNDFNDDIELLEPVGVSAQYATVERRDFVDYKIISGKVVPHVNEVYFNSSQNFLKYGVLPGNDVKKGDAILYASTEKIDEEIKNLEDKIKDAEDSYNESVKDYNDNIEKLKREVSNNQDVVDNFENITDHSTYPNYDSEYAKYKGYLASYTSSLQRNEQNLKKLVETYALDADYNNTLLNRLKSKRSNVLATANNNGTVVAVNYYNSGDYIDKETAVAAVGDFNSLEVKTDYVYKSEITKALDVYAVVNGKHYNVSYIDPGKSESTTNTSTLYSTFEIDNSTGEIKAGDFVTIVIINSRREDVLSVPKESIITESGTSYVYLYNGNDSEYTIVKKGITQGYYTEIISGLSEGDKILSDFTIKESKTTVKIEKGTISSEFSAGGYLFYSKTEWIKNPVEYGTTYVSEVLVKNNERVEKGQIIAKVWVVSDDIELRSLERKILRANEDLTSLKKQLTDEENKQLNKSITNKQKEIDDLNETLSKIKKDKNVTSITAPYSGIISQVKSFEEGDILQSKGNVALIAKEEDCFLLVEDEGGALTCGNTAAITFKDNDNVERTISGEVVTVSSVALSESLKTGYSLIRVSSEALEMMSALNNGGYGYWMRSRFSVKVPTRVIDNVILVPRTAVTLQGGVTYVTILDDNNKPFYKSFVSGGSDNRYYWVAEGLDEGTIICLD